MSELPLPEVAGVEHRFADLAGVRVHYAQAGSGDPLVLLHGWPQHWWAWRKVIGPLAERHRVICPDLRGCGWSSAPPSGYDKPRLAEDLVELLDALGLDRVKLIGHDWGAFAGYIACVRHPERFERFIGLGIPPPWRPGGPPGPTEAIRQLLRLSYQLPLAPPGLGPLVVSRSPYARLMFEKGRTYGRWTAEELETYLRPLRRPAHARAASRIYRSFLTEDLPAIARGDLPGGRLTVPTRGIIGGTDIFAKGIADEHAEHAEDLEFAFIPGCGHFVPEERPDVVLERSAEFLGT